MKQDQKSWLTMYLQLKKKHTASQKTESSDKCSIVCKGHEENYLRFLSDDVYIWRGREQLATWEVEHLLVYTLPPLYLCNSVFLYLYMCMFICEFGFVYLYFQRVISNMSGGAPVRVHTAPHPPTDLH